MRNWKGVEKFLTYEIARLHNTPVEWCRILQLWDPKFIARFRSHLLVGKYTKYHTVTYYMSPMSTAEPMFNSV